MTLWCLRNSLSNIHPLWCKLKIHKLTLLLHRFTLWSLNNSKWCRWVEEGSKCSKWVTVPTRWTFPNSSSSSSRNTSLPTAPSTQKIRFTCHTRCRKTGRVLIKNKCQKRQTTCTCPWMGAWIIQSFMSSSSTPTDSGSSKLTGRTLSIMSKSLKCHRRVSWLNKKTTAINHEKEADPWLDR